MKGIAASAVTADSIRAIVGEAVGSAAQGPGLADAAIPAILAGLGWTGPPAIAALVGLKILSTLIRRRRKRSKEGAGSPAPEFRAEPVGSIPRNDTETIEFLRLSQLEGRSPLRDALIGRLTFDALDNAIESQPDGPEANWARRLKRQLEDRFNEMAPPAVYAAGQTS